MTYCTQDGVLYFVFLQMQSKLQLSFFWRSATTFAETECYRDQFEKGLEGRERGRGKRRGIEAILISSGSTPLCDQQRQQGLKRTDQSSVRNAAHVVESKPADPEMESVVRQLKPKGASWKCGCVSGHRYKPR